MKDRSERLKKIKELIRNHRIESQESLLSLLEKEHFNVTQATLSRDLKYLRVSKISDGWSGYYYSLPTDESPPKAEQGYIQDARRGIVALEFSYNFGVIKTLPGHADSVALALDKLNLPEILGTVAGDDTIFVILREGMTKEDLTTSFQSKIPEVDT
ncbi:MAG: ArgR family transcriptional regulator [Spirochaetia bacterium]|nr:ArgR family transcriptional regulator [Spirochaetia bacterium]